MSLADVLVSLEPWPEGRRIVADVLGDRAAWLADGLDAATVAGARVLLASWPRKELRAAGLDWEDLPGLEAVQINTAGANHVGWSTVPERLQVGATPGATAQPIGEYVLGAVIAWCRGFAASTQDIREGRFVFGAPVRSLAGLRVGLVGYGGIGQEVGRLLAAHGCDVAAVNRSGTGPEAGLRWLGTMADLDRLVSESTVLVLCLPLVRETEGLVDGRLLGMLPPDGALLVNVARGRIVEEDALYAWLAGDPDRRWAHLDVWWDYPRDGGHPFRRRFDTLPNVTMTPHNSPNVPGFREAMLEPACRHVLRFLDSGRLPHRVDRDAHTLAG